jgi:hypothetical protein
VAQQSIWPGFGHGRACTDDNGLLARQLLTPELPMFGTPGARRTGGRESRWSGRGDYVHIP